MSSREIVQRLIDEKLLSGEEAFTLINDLCKAEMLDTWQMLEGKNKNSSSYISGGVKINNTPYTISSVGDSSATTYGGYATVATCR